MSLLTALYSTINKVVTQHRKANYEVKQVSSGGLILYEKNLVTEYEEAHCTGLLLLADIYFSDAVDEAL